MQFQMRALFTFLLIVSITIKGYSQYYLNQTESFVRNDVSYPITVDYTNDSHLKYLTWTDTHNTVTSVIFSGRTGLAIQQTAIPNQDNIAGWVQALNAKDVRVSDTEWKEYMGGSVVDVRLKYIDGFWCFLFTDITE